MGIIKSRLRSDRRGWRQYQGHVHAALTRDSRRAGVIRFITGIGRTAVLTRSHDGDQGARFLDAGAEAKRTQAGRLSANGQYDSHPDQESDGGAHQAIAFGRLGSETQMDSAARVRSTHCSSAIR